MRWYSFWIENLDRKAAAWICIIFHKPVEDCDVWSRLFNEGYIAHTLSIWITRKIVLRRCKGGQWNWSNVQIRRIMNTGWELRVWHHWKRKDREGIWSRSFIDRQAQPKSGVIFPACKESTVSKVISWNCLNHDACQPVYNTVFL